MQPNSKGRYECYSCQQTFAQASSLSRHKTSGNCTRKVYMCHSAGCDVESMSYGWLTAQHFVREHPEQTCPRGDQIHYRREAGSGPVKKDSDGNRDTDLEVLELHADGEIDCEDHPVVTPLLQIHIPRSAVREGTSMAPGSSGLNREELPTHDPPRGTKRKSELPATAQRAPMQDPDSHPRSPSAKAPKRKPEPSDKSQLCPPKNSPVSEPVLEKDAQHSLPSIFQG